MTLVLQTINEIDPASNEAIRELIGRYDLVQQDSPVTFGVDMFSYYHLGSHHDAKHIIEEFIRLPGVAAAYIKHGGSPPL